jgi:hypothetical protein
LFLVKNEDIKKHRGEYLNWFVRRKGIKIKFLTEVARYDRTTFYNHIKDPNLPYTVLSRYGEVLGHDFSEDYPEFKDPAGNDRDKISSFEEMEKDRDKWKHKYDVVIELLNKCMEGRDPSSSETVH